jgi:hypothetical protein
VGGGDGEWRWFSLHTSLTSLTLPRLWRGPLPSPVGRGNRGAMRRLPPELQWVYFECDRGGAPWGRRIESVARCSAIHSWTPDRALALLVCPG